MAQFDWPIFRSTIGLETELLFGYHREGDDQWVEWSSLLAVHRKVLQQSRRWRWSLCHAAIEMAEFSRQEPLSQKTLSFPSWVFTDRNSRRQTAKGHRHRPMQASSAGVSGQFLRAQATRGPGAPFGRAPIRAHEPRLGLTSPDRGSRTPIGGRASSHSHPKDITSAQWSVLGSMTCCAHQRYESEDDGESEDPCMEIEDTCTPADEVACRDLQTIPEVSSDDRTYAYHFSDQLINCTCAVPERFAR